MKKYTVGPRVLDDDFVQLEIAIEEVIDNPMMPRAIAKTVGGLMLVLCQVLDRLNEIDERLDALEKIGTKNDQSDDSKNQLPGMR